MIMYGWPDYNGFIYLLFILAVHHIACGILISWPKIEPSPPAVEA